MLTVGSLFAGIGGFDLGLERAGMRVIWQSEIDPYASAVLRRVVGDLASLGYDAEWSIVSACAFGAPHARERVFLLAYPNFARFKDGINHLQRNALPALSPHWQATQGKCEWNGVERWLGATVQAGDWSDSDGQVLGMDDGIPARLHAIGNAIVPQIAEVIGRAIVAAHGERMAA
jgi:DNA (cytosine-5)-methyltransferase 1